MPIGMRTLHGILRLERPVVAMSWSSARTAILAAPRSNSSCRTRFGEKHGARVRSFMPTMLAMRGDNGRLCSVAGFRCAAHEPLFLERYLSEPVENAIAAACGHAVDRAQIVEVGNLAGVTCRASLRLIVELPRLLLARGQRWIVFTASEAVRSVLAGYHAPLVQLVAAEASRVAGLGDDWGRYYETDPRVMAGFLPDGRLDRRRRGMHD